MDAVAVVWSRRAQRDRDRIFSYVAAQATPARAYAVIRAIAERAAWLGENPDGGVEIGPQRRELVVPHLPYVIEYERRPDRVRILYTWGIKRKTATPRDDVEGIDRGRYRYFAAEGSALRSEQGPTSHGICTWSRL